MVSDGKHHCGSVADAVCVCAMWCVCEWGDGVGGGGCGMVWSTHSTPWCVWWCMWRVCVAVVHAPSPVCVCEGGGGTRALVVVVGGKASVMVAWEAHTGHTRTTKHHHGPHHQSRCVCVCVMVGHKGRGGGDHTSNHPCMGHACASRVCVWRMRVGG